MTFNKENLPTVMPLHSSMTSLLLPNKVDNMDEAVVDVLTIVGFGAARPIADGSISLA